MVRCPLHFQVTRTIEPFFKDFSKFFDDEFNVTDWLNQAFRVQKDSNQNVDAYTGTLITKLQMYIQEMNNSIEETSQQAIQQFPRFVAMLLSDLSAMHEPLLPLQSSARHRCAQTRRHFTARTNAYGARRHSKSQSGYG